MKATHLLDLEAFKAALRAKAIQLEGLGRSDTEWAQTSDGRASGLGLASAMLEDFVVPIPKEES